MLLICFCILLPIAVCAAPVGNIGDPALWNPGPFQKDGGISIITTVSFDRQVNDLPEQITRFPWTNPNISPPEQRHYPQTRKSKNTMDTMGLKVGAPINDSSIIYALLGTSTSTINFDYSDWTVSRSYASHDTFESGPDLYYGMGASFVMHRGEYKGDIPVTFGMDITYRRLTIEEDRFKSEGISYASTLDEVQLAFCLSANMPTYSPYMGVKVASITGSEDYTNRNYSTLYFNEGFIHYTEDITWSKNIGYFVGVTMNIKELFSLGLEIRAGDEKGLGINVTSRF